MSVCKVLDRRGGALFIGAPFTGRVSKSDGRQNGDFADSSDGFGSCPIEFDARRVRPLAVNHGNLKFMTYQKCLIRAKSDTDFIPAPEPGLCDLARKKSRWQPIGGCQRTEELGHAS